MEGWHLRQTSELSFTSTSSEDTISESVVQRRSSIGHGSLTSWSLQSSTLTSVSEYVPLQAQNSWLLLKQLHNSLSHANSKNAVAISGWLLKFTQVSLTYQVPLNYLSFSSTIFSMQCKQILTLQFPALVANSVVAMLHMHLWMANEINIIFWSRVLGGYNSCTVSCHVGVKTAMLKLHIAGSQYIA